MSGCSVAIGYWRTACSGTAVLSALQTFVDFKSGAQKHADAAAKEVITQSGFADSKMRTQLRGFWRKKRNSKNGEVHPAQKMRNPRISRVPAWIGAMR
jgi:hypothetical protein